MTIRATTVFVVLISALSVATVVKGATKEEAQSHFQNGVSMMEVEDFAGAAIELEASVAAYPTKSALFNLGMCYKALHEYPRALSTFERLKKEYGVVLGDAERMEVDSSLRTLKKLIATVVVQVDVDGADVMLNNKSVGVSPLPSEIVVGAGNHVLSVSKDGYVTAEESFSIISGKKKILGFELEPVPAKPVPVVAPVLETPAAAPAKEQIQPEVEPEQPVPAVAPVQPVPTGTTTEPDKADADPPVASVKDPSSDTEEKLDEAMTTAPEEEAASVDDVVNASQWLRFYGHLGYVGLAPGFGAWAYELEGTQVGDNGFSTGMWNGLRLAGFFAPSHRFHIGGYFQVNGGSGDYRYWRDPFTGGREKKESKSLLITMGFALKMGGRAGRRVWIGFANDLGLSAFSFHTEKTTSSADPKDMVAQLGFHFTPKLEIDVLILTGRFKMALDIALGVMITPLIGGSPYEDLKDNFGNSIDNTLIWSFVQPMFQLGLSFGG